MKTELIVSKCIFGSCPSIFKTEQGNYVIVGRVLSSKELAINVKKKIGPGELAIEIPGKLLKRLIT